MRITTTFQATNPASPDKPIQATAEVELHDIRDASGQVQLSAQIRLSFAMPPQDERLVDQVEQAIEDAGQQLKRQLFVCAMEFADRQLLLAQRGGKGGQGFQCRGSVALTCKTVFGTAAPRRQRVAHKVDGSSEVLSARVWQTPQQVFLTQGLKDAVCDGLLEQSASGTLQRVEARAGEPGLIARRTVLNIVHEEGNALRAELARRADEVWADEPQARQRLLPSAPSEEGEAEPDPVLAATDPVEAEGAALLGFPGAPAAAAVGEQEAPRRVDPGTVLVEADEDRVKAQASTGHKALLVYTAVVLTAARAWYFTAETSAQLIHEVGALLARLGVHRGQERLVFLADGAGWIRSWFEGLAVSSKVMILCWYHLAKRCEQQLSQACKGRGQREEVLAEVLGQLWEGRVDEALAVLKARRPQMRCGLAVDQLIGYLEKRRPYLPNYKARREGGLWIASNRVEKFNDWSISERCKGRGMEWTSEGVNALAAMAAAQRNGELETWRRTRELPAWEVESPPPQAA
jgi:hypothetical protein